jgi:hypothetical protein
MPRLYVINLFFLLWNVTRPRFRSEAAQIIKYGSWKARLSKSKLEVRIFYSSKIWIKFGSWKARRLNRALLLSETNFFPPPPEGRNFLHGGSVDLFWKDPLFKSLNITKILDLVTQNITLFMYQFYHQLKFRGVAKGGCGGCRTPPMLCPSAQ